METFCHTIVHIALELHIHTHNAFSCSILQIQVLKNAVVEGQVIDLEDIHDGMVVTSMAGYPMTFLSNPFRLNNINISTTSKDIHYKNGVIHTLVNYPKPSAPWLGKTMQYILQETNDKYKGNLSDFIAFIAVTPDIQVLLQANSTDATTLFVPTNDALAIWKLTLMQQGQEIDGTMIQQLVKNHVVNGNFVRSSWWMIPTGTKLSNDPQGFVDYLYEFLNSTNYGRLETNGDINFYK